jgi:AraC family transcriptional regulator, regulatory protein of adaptative response / methylated-DNA-[protein]-cysteine methyltransferase
MQKEDQINYNRVAEAIAYIHANFKTQPSLEEIAAQIHLSPFHFQRIFSEWAGTTPKKFLQYISIEHAKNLLQQQATLADTSHQTGLSSTARLHDLFVNIEGMSPAEYKNEGQNLLIQYSFAPSPFGEMIVASTAKGICYMAFIENEISAFSALQQRFAKAKFVLASNGFQQNALALFQEDWSELSSVKLHLKGTNFQLKVWETLLKIPMGRLTTYGAIASEIAQPTASRAVGTAIGSNPVAFLIPCHRVIQGTGNLGGYRWGNTRKTGIIGWESAKNE